MAICFMLLSLWACLLTRKIPRMAVLFRNKSKNIEEILLFQAFLIHFGDPDVPATRRHSRFRGATIIQRLNTDRKSVRRGTYNTTYNFAYYAQPTFLRLEDSRDSAAAQLFSTISTPKPTRAWYFQPTSTHIG